MTKLPACPLWHQALNFMVTGEPRDCDPDLIDMEHAYAAAVGDSPPVCRMSREDAMAALLDRLESGVAIATGEKREAIGVNGYRADSLPSAIPASAWPNLRLDDATSFAEIDRLKVSIPGQGYANVRLRREDVLAACAAVLAEQRAEQVALIGMLAPLEPEAPTVQQDAPALVSRTLSEREVRDWLDQRASAAKAQAGPWQGQDAMRRACKAELGGNFARERFNKLRLNAMQRHDVKRPPAGRRIVPAN